MGSDNTNIYSKINRELNIRNIWVIGPCERIKGFNEWKCFMKWKRMSKTNKKSISASNIANFKTLASAKIEMCVIVFLYTHIESMCSIVLLHPVYTYYSGFRL